MIMINFAGGLALFLGGLRHREQTYNFQGTSAFLAVVITLSVLGFILPNYTEATPRRKRDERSSNRHHRSSRCLSTSPFC